MGTPIVVEFLPEDQLCIVVTTVGEVLQWCLVDDSVSLYHYYCCSISFPRFSLIYIVIVVLILFAMTFSRQNSRNRVKTLNSK